MKASELIMELQKLVDEHGDRDIDINGEDFCAEIDTVCLASCCPPEDKFFEIWGTNESE